MEYKDMKVVILCGGKGTRLREETEFKPKPLVNVGGSPILWHIMKIYSHYGYNNFVLCLGYKGHMIKDYFINFVERQQDVTINLKSGKKVIHHEKENMPDWNITFAETGAESNTGARIKKIEKYIDTENFMVTYGDGVADVDIKDLVDFHMAHNSVATVTSIVPPTRWSNLRIGEESIVSGFKKGEKLEGWWIDGGFFMFNKKIFDYLTEDEDCMLEREPLETLAKEGNLKAYKHDSFWQCMDTIRDMKFLDDIWKMGKAPWKVWEE
jgi:glucose-1-phosphate cytidylyltransferase